MEQFTRHGDYLDMELSPDGKHVFARVRVEGLVAILFIETKTMNVVGGVRPPNKGQIHSAEWINNERIVYQLQEKQSRYDAPVATGELFAINIDGSRSTILFGYRAGNAETGSRISNREDVRASAEILSYLPEDDKYILVAEYPWTLIGNTLYDDRKKNPNIVRLNVYTGTRRRVETIPFPGAKVFATQNGDIKFARWIDETNTLNTASRKSEDDEWTPFEVDGIPDFVPIALSNDGTKVFAYGDMTDKELNTIYQLDLETQEVSKLFGDITTDIFDINWDPALNMPVVGMSYPGKVQYSYAPVESETASLHKRLIPAFGSQKVSIPSQSKNGEILLLRIDSDVNPGEYYLFNTKTNGAEFIWANRSWIDPRILSAKQPISFETEDGLTVHGYVTLPQGTTAEDKLPMVVMLHGGPHGVYDRWECDTESQLLANRGYAVLQVNFRGSGGYGDAYLRAGYREWGGKMIQDILDATEYTVANFPIDRDRMCTYGASYGGYAAVMATVRAPDMYKCAIGYVGLYDLSFAYTDSDITRSLGGQAYLERVIGTDPEELAANSPVNFTDKIKANIMLIHGERDARVSVENSEVLKERLEANGKEVPYLNFSRAGHGVFDESGRYELYTAMVEFFNENIGK
jgi:dipeptidyl aminopeptidase/acylaminoacyl peptidase